MLQLFEWISAIVRISSYCIPFVFFELCLAEVVKSKSVASIFAAIFGFLCVVGHVARLTIIPGVHVTADQSGSSAIEIIVFNGFVLPGLFIGLAFLLWCTIKRGAAS